MKNTVRISIKKKTILDEMFFGQCIASVILRALVRLTVRQGLARTVLVF
jgi:hypothetical protein